MAENVFTVKGIDINRVERIMLTWDRKEIVREGDTVSACTEWLLGTFAGRSFEGRTKREAIRKMCDYFDQTKGTDSMVGRKLEEMQWPDLNYIENKLFGNDIEK